MNTTIGLFLADSDPLRHLPSHREMHVKSATGRWPEPSGLPGDLRLGFVEVPCNLEPLIKVAFDLAITNTPVTLEHAAKNGTCGRRRQAKDKVLNRIRNTFVRV